MRYSDITDIESLDKARRILSRRVERKGEEVLERWNEMKDAYSPMGLLASGIRSISGSIPFERILFYGLRMIRRRFI